MRPNLKRLAEVKRGDFLSACSVSNKYIIGAYEDDYFLDIATAIVLYDSGDEYKGIETIVLNQFGIEFLLECGDDVGDWCEYCILVDKLPSKSSWLSKGLIKSVQSSFDVNEEEAWEQIIKEANMIGMPYSEKIESL